MSKLKDVQADIDTPVPAEKHVFCGVCNENYSDYKRHVKSSLHKESVDSNSLYIQIDDEIKELNLILESKYAQQEQKNQVEKQKSSRKIVRIKRT